MRVSGEEAWNAELRMLGSRMRITGEGQDVANEAGGPSICCVWDVALLGTVGQFSLTPGPVHRVM